MKIFKRRSVCIISLKSWVFYNSVGWGGEVVKGDCGVIRNDG